MNRIANEDGMQEIQFANFEKSDRPHRLVVHAEAGRERENQDSVSDRFAKGCRLRVVMIDVNGIEVAADPGIVHDVGFGQGASRRFPFLAHFHFIEEHVHT